MFVAAHEWTLPPEKVASLASPCGQTPASAHGIRQLYESLSTGRADEAVKQQAIDFLQHTLHQVQGLPSDLPPTPQGLSAWVQASVQSASARYRAYLEERKVGGPRRYFTNRAHALYFLRAVAPTKLVDGAWLYGLLAHAGNPRFSNLIATYVEELGEGRADKNHVLLYRRLLERHGLTPVQDLPEDFYTQGVLQLALGLNAGQFLPEVIGFNLGYEQLPLHLLITAYELNELGLDPYYFTLHITVDNADTGHAQRAVQAVFDTLPQWGGHEDFWQRVCNGSKLGSVGVGTTEAIQGFDIGREVVSVLARKSVTGQGAHSDYCRVAGRSINDWLAGPGNIPDFLKALEQAGWIKRGAAPRESRFWKLLEGDKAEMFGVFSPYELQLIHDWIRGDASADGQAYDEPALGRRRASFRSLSRQAQPLGSLANPGLLKVLEDSPDDCGMLDPDLQALQAELAVNSSPEAQKRLLVSAMSPWMHWTPAGLHATRRFLQTSI